MDTVVITNQKGGVGKSTITALLAWWLREKEQARVALLDLDCQKNLTRTFVPQRYEVSATRLFGPTYPLGICLRAARAFLRARRDLNGSFAASNINC
jgi:cellulose biosynthesis protein BcsQ